MVDAEVSWAPVVQDISDVVVVIAWGFGAGRLRRWSHIAHSFVTVYIRWPVAVLNLEVEPGTFTTLPLHLLTEDTVVELVAVLLMGQEVVDTEVGWTAIV